MKQQHLVGLAAVLLLLVVVAWLVGVFDSDISTVDVPELRVPAAEVDEIVLNGPEIHLVARKSDGRWVIAEPIQGRADSAAVQRFVDGLASTEIRSVATRNAERYSRYGVDTTAHEISVRWRGETRKLIVGDTGPTTGTRFVRLEGDEPVYVAATNFRIPTNADEWRDRNVVEIAPEDVRQIRIERAADSFALDRTNGNWALAMKDMRSDADSAAVARYLARFDPLRADGFLEELPEAVEDSIITITISLDGSEDRTLRLAPIENGVAVTIDGDDTLYRLTTRRRDLLAPEANEFAIEEADAS